VAHVENVAILSVSVGTGSHRSSDSLSAYVYPSKETDTIVSFSELAFGFLDLGLQLKQATRSTPPLPGPASAASCKNTEPVQRATGALAAVRLRQQGRRAAAAFPLYAGGVSDGAGTIRKGNGEFQEARRFPSREVSRVQGPAPLPTTPSRARSFNATPASATGIHSVAPSGDVDGATSTAALELALAAAAACCAGRHGRMMLLLRVGSGGGGSGSCPCRRCRRCRRCRWTVRVRPPNGAAIDPPRDWGRRLPRRRRRHRPPRMAAVKVWVGRISHPLLPRRVAGGGRLPPEFPLPGGGGARAGGRAAAAAAAAAATAEVCRAGGRGSPGAAVHQKRRHASCSGADRGRGAANGGVPPPLNAPQPLGGGLPRQQPHVGRRPRGPAASGGLHPAGATGGHGRRRVRRRKWRGV